MDEFLWFQDYNDKKNPEVTIGKHKYVLLYFNTLQSVKIKSVKNTLLKIA